MLYILPRKNPQNTTKLNAVSYVIRLIEITSVFRIRLSVIAVLNRRALFFDILKCFVPCRHLDSSRQFKNILNQALAEYGGVFGKEVKYGQIRALLQQITDTFFLEDGKIRLGVSTVGRQSVDTQNKATTTQKTIYTYLMSLYRYVYIQYSVIRLSVRFCILNTKILQCNATRKSCKYIVKAV